MFLGTIIILFLEIRIYFFPLFLYISALHFSLLHLFAKNISKSGAWLIVLPLLVFIHRFAGRKGVARVRLENPPCYGGGSRRRAEVLRLYTGQSRRRAEGIARVTGVQRLMNRPALSVTLAFLLQDGDKTHGTGKTQATDKTHGAGKTHEPGKAHGAGKTHEAGKARSKENTRRKSTGEQDAGPTIRCTRAQKRLPHAPGYCIIHLSGRLRRRIVILSRCRAVRLSQNPITIKRRT